MCFEVATLTCMRWWNVCLSGCIPMATMSSKIPRASAYKPSCAHACSKQLYVVLSGLTPSVFMRFTIVNTALVFPRSSCEAIIMLKRASGVCVGPRKLVSDSAYRRCGLS